VSLARDLSNVRKPEVSAAAFPLGFPQPLTIESLGDPVEIASASTATLGHTSQNVPLLVGGPLGGVLALSVAAGAFIFRLRRRTAAGADPSS